MAKDDFIKIGLVQLAAHGTHACSSETLGVPCPHTTNCGLLKQPDKHEMPYSIPVNSLPLQGAPVQFNRDGTGRIDEKPGLVP
jgi:hypothetical protein